MQTKQRLDALTSLRFFAAAMIVLGHSHRLFGSFGLATTLSFAQGVSFFFVLSGFILAYNYPVLTTRAEIGSFFKARIARIWPAHIAAIGLLFLLTSEMNIEGLSTSKTYFSAVANLFLFQSIIPLRSVFLTFNAVAWSISTEMFFYFAFPFLITGILPGWKIKLFFLGAIFLLYLWFAAAWQIPADESLPQLNLMGLLYVNPLVRILEFFTGVLTCNMYIKLRVATSTEQRAWLFTLAELVIVGLALTNMWLSPRITTFLGWQGDEANVVNFYLQKAGSFPVFAVLILIFALGRGMLSRALSWSFAILLGEISFALYLVHTTVLRWYELNMPYFTDLPELSKAIGYWLLSLFIAWLLHKIIENPCRKFILSFTKTEKTKALKAFFADRQVIYLSLAVVTLVAMKTIPMLIAIPSCPAEGCEAIIKEAQLPTPAKFGNYISLLAIRSQPQKNGDQFFDIVFKVEQPLPSEHKLAVHIVTADGTIVTQIDTPIVKNRALKSGDLWMEHIQIPARLMNPEAVRLGLAIYADPAAPLSVEYPTVDYGGKRMLVDFALI
jgi:peptidoglycan/LPS O-acetylase OafA/YrhL